MDRFLDATPKAGKEFFARQIQTEVVMLNLLKFRKIADYSGIESLSPGKKVSGKEAYRLYIDHTLPFLKNAGSEVIFYGNGGRFLIGPENEKWGGILLVRHRSSAKFMEFARNNEYLAVAGHRKAALEDSRLLPIEEGSILEI